MRIPIAVVVMQMQMGEANPQNVQPTIQIVQGAAAAEAEPVPHIQAGPRRIAGQTRQKLRQGGRGLLIGIFQTQGRVAGMSVQKSAPGGLRGVQPGLAPVAVHVPVVRGVAHHVPGPVFHGQLDSQGQPSPCGGQDQRIPASGTQIQKRQVRGHAQPGIAQTPRQPGMAAG